MAPALAAHRATDVLRYVARHHDDHLTLSVLAERLEVSGAAMHAVLEALTSAGLLERSEPAKTYRLGPEATVIGSAARAQDVDLHEAAAAASRIVDSHGLFVTILAQRGTEILVIDGFGYRRTPNEFMVPGRSIPFAPPFGAVFAASLPPQAVVAWMQRAGVDPASAVADRYRNELAQVAKRGWSVGMVPGALSDPNEAWSDMVDSVDTQSAEPAHLDYLGVDSPGDGLVMPTVFNLGLSRQDDATSGQSHASMALAVSGFESPMTAAEVAVVGEALVSTAAIGRSQLPTAS